jgi:type II secretory pathway pseudopilin PulG
MELMTVLVIISILIALTVPVYVGLRGKAERGGCISNLKNLFSGASAYLDDQGHWPQVPPTKIGEPEFAAAWIRALEPYHISEDNWLCPSLQRKFGKTSSSSAPLEKRARIDYFATPFDAEPTSPRRWTTQPWFVETADSHGDGNLLVFPDGRVKSLTEVRRDVILQPLQQ